MASTIVLCTDGSDLALHALTAGLALLRPGDTTVLATVIEPADPSLVSGVSGFGGGVMSAEQLQELENARQAEARDTIDRTARALGLTGVDGRVLAGDAGHELCSLAEDLAASVLVMGSRGRGGLRRAVLGSVSDHVVRHAPCPVLIANPEAAADDDAGGDA